MRKSRSTPPSPSASKTNRPPDSDVRFIAGDPLRAIAALGVFIFHAGYTAVTSSGYSGLLTPNAASRTMFGSVIGVPLSSVGATVPIFFCLSGYLIARPFVGSFVTGDAPPRLLRYVRNRLVRLVPALWVIFTVLLLLYGTRGASVSQVASVYGFSADWHTSPFAPVIAQAWTLNVEARFYGVIALSGLMLLGLRRALQGGRGSPEARAGCVVLVVAGTGALSLAAYRHTSPAASLSLASLWPSFAPGIMLAALEPVLARRVAGAVWVRHAAPLLFGVGMAALVSLTVLAHPWADVIGAGPHVGVRLYVALMATALIGAPLLLQWSQGTCWRILDNHALQWLGARSYSFYLIHFVVLGKLGSALSGLGGYKVIMAVLLPVSLVITALLAELSFRFVEAPSMGLRGSRRYRRPPVRPTPAQVETATGSVCGTVAGGEAA